MIALLPALLIIVEPDLGTGLLILINIFSDCFLSLVKMENNFHHCDAFCSSGTVMYKFGLKEYQKKRILTFIDPDADAQGSGYNAIQSKISIGSGKILERVI